MKVNLFGITIVVSMMLLAKIATIPSYNDSGSKYQRHLNDDDEESDEEENEAYNMVLKAMLKSGKKPAPAKKIPFDVDVEQINEELKSLEKTAEEELKSPEDLEKLEEEENKLEEKAEIAKKEVGLTDEEIQEAKKEGVPQIKLKLQEPKIIEEPLILMNEAKQTMNNLKSRGIELMDIDGELTLPYLSPQELKEIVDIENEVISKEEYPFNFNTKLNNPEQSKKSADLNSNKSKEKCKDNSCKDADHKLVNFDRKLNAALLILANMPEEEKNKTNGDHRTTSNMVHDLNSFLSSIHHDTKTHSLTRKLSKIATMYEEHRRFANGSYIADPSHYRYLRYFTHSMDCIIQGCNYANHLENIRKLEENEYKSEDDSDTKVYSKEEGKRISKIRQIFTKIADQLNNLFATEAKKSIDEDENENANKRILSEKNDESNNFDKSKAEDENTNVSEKSNQESKADEKDSDEAKENEDEIGNNMQFIILMIDPNGNLIEDTLNQLSPNDSRLINEEDINNASNSFIENLFKNINNIENDQNQNLAKYQEYIDDMDKYTQKHRNLNPSEFRHLISHIGELARHYTNKEMQTNNFGNEKLILYQISQKIEVIKQKLDNSIPIENVIDEEVNDLLAQFLDKLQHSDDYSRLGSDETDKAKEKASEIIKYQSNQADDNQDSISLGDNNLNIIKDLQTDINDIITPKSLEWIIHKAVAGSFKNLEDLNKENKASKFALDANDINYLVDEIKEEIISIRDQRHELIERVKEAKVKFSENPEAFASNSSNGNSVNKTEMSKDLVAKTEELLNSFIKKLEAEESTLNAWISSEGFKEKLEDIVVKYWNAFLNHSSEIKTDKKYNHLSKSLSNDLRSLSTTPSKRILAELSIIHAKYAHVLDNNDHRFLNFMQRLLMEFNSHNKADIFERKLDKVLKALNSDRHFKDIDLSLQPTSSAHLMGIKNGLKEFQDSFSDLSSNLTKTYEKARELDQTISTAEQKVKNTVNGFGIGKLVLNNNGETTFSKISGLFTKKPEEPRKLVFDPAGSFKNIYNNVATAKKKARTLVENYDAAMDNANQFKQLYEKIISWKRL